MYGVQERKIELRCTSPIWMAQMMQSMHSEGKMTEAYKAWMIEIISTFGLLFGKGTREQERDIGEALGGS